MRKACEQREAGEDCGNGGHGGNVEILYINRKHKFMEAIMNALTQAFHTTCIPKDNKPEYNAETLAAIQEAKDIMAGKIKTKRYKTVEEMNADIDAEEDD
jgi:antitoxin component of RelBE/YafQ-DinJ toxin-antitoxin module